MSFLDPLLNPLLTLSPLWVIILISLLVAVLMTVIYKWMTDQDLMKVLKDDIKKFQNEMKELRQHPEKMMEVQKKAMETNMKYMMQSMKPTFVTFIPIILVFGWLQAHLVYSPIMPGEEFQSFIEFEEGFTGNAEIITPEEIELLSGKSVEVKDGKASWILKGSLGSHMLEYTVNDKSYNKHLEITNKQFYENPIKNIDDGKVKTIQVKHEEIKLLNLFGWKIGWLGSYIIFSIVFSMLLRKLLKVH